MKIGVNGRFLLKPYTGIGQYTKNLLREMAFSSGDRDEYVVLVPEKLPEKMSVGFGKNVTFVVLPERKLGLAGAKKTWWEQIQVPEKFVKECVDVAFFPYPSNPWTKDWYKRDVKTVVTVHDCIPWQDKRYLRGVLSKMYHGQSRRAVGLADKVLTVSGSSMKDIVEVCGVDKAKIEVVYNDADAVYKEAPEKKYCETVLSRFGLKDEQFVLYVGGYDERKNVKGLIEEWKKWEKFPLVLAGGKVMGGKLYKSFEASAGGGVVKTGFLSEDELNVLYRKCLFFINLSGAEGFNLPILEAANCGASMILSDIPVHREVAEDSALFVKTSVKGSVEKAMDKMLDEKFRKDLKKKDEVLAKKYSWKKYGAMVRKIFAAI